VTESKPSKSARKREHLALQELGEKLISLSEAELESLSLDEGLLKAVRDAGQTKAHGALRRQKQLIGKLMRGVDPEPIRAAIAIFSAYDLRCKRTFAIAERWRDRIIRDGTEALHEFDAETGEADTELRTLLGKLDIAFSERAEKTVRRQIFRRIHDILAERGQSPLGGKGSDPSL
jgi:ribosome-associated protein